MCGCVVCLLKYIVTIPDCIKTYWNAGWHDYRIGKLGEFIQNSTHLLI